MHVELGFDFCDDFRASRACCIAPSGTVRDRECMVEFDSSFKAKKNRLRAAQ